MTNIQLAIEVGHLLDNVKKSQSVLAEYLFNNGLTENNVHLDIAEREAIRSLEFLFRQIGVEEIKRLEERSRK